MSGVATNPWAFSMNAKETAKLITTGLDCPTDDSLRMTECLRDRPANKLVENIKHTIVRLELNKMCVSIQHTYYTYFKLFLFIFF